MRKARYPLAALTACLLAVSASAQLAPGVSGFSDAPTQASNEEYWFFVRELGYCLAKSKRAQSIALMQTAIDSPEEARVFRTLINRNGNNICMHNMVSAMIVRGQVRGAIAEGLYKLSGVSAAEPALATAPDATVAVKTLDDFADCYVSTNYAKAHALVMDTGLGTKAEKGRVRDMASGFGACLPAGREVRFSPMTVRLALAGALYRAGNARPQLAQGSN